jgi:hypothetical protein
MIELPGSASSRRGPLDHGGPIEWALPFGTNSAYLQVEERNGPARAPLRGYGRLPLRFPSLPFPD